jgi:TonB-dependent SusC/RagA subfamily outer membrane receptor
MRKFFLLALTAVCMHAVAIAQDNNPPKAETGIKNIIERLTLLSTDQIIEKAYLHFDKPYYDPGDTIYFKAYVTAGERHELSKISGVLHVDLISKNDSVMQSLILQLNNGQANADFALPNYVTKGNYRIRAYTQWMQNTGSKYFFDKVIPVTGRGLTKLKPIDYKTDIQFFAEGGSFVSGLPARVSFKAIGADGLGINIKGVVVDNYSKEVTKFTTAHLGMGQFFLTPEGSKTYHARITFPDGKIALVDLPKPEAKGISLNVNNNAADKIAIEINANKPYYLEHKNKEISVVIYNAGIVKTVKTVLDNQVLGFDLLKKDLRTGVVQVTLFSQEGTPLNERLAFIQNNPILNLNVNTDKADYANPDKVQVNLKAVAGEKPAQGYFSVSVINESKVQADDNAERNIMSDLLLASEVTGYIEQPGYYFNNVTADTRKNLDILMLTQGYRRFVWKELNAANVVTNNYQPENALQIKGTLQTLKGEPVANEKMVLMARQSGLLLNSLTDANGRFVFDKISFLDKTQFVLKTDNASSKLKTRITLDQTAANVSVAPLSIPPGKVSDELPGYNTQTEGGYQTQTSPRLLNAVMVNNKPAYRSSNLAGAGNADQVINRNAIKNASTLSAGLDGVARGVRFENGRAYLRNSVVAKPGSTTIDPMLIVVDGTINSAETSLDSFNPVEIESVEILRGASASIYGMSGGAGVIIINTRQGGDSDDVVKETANGLLSVMPQGFYKAREFYLPNNNVAKPNSEQSTVYWKPNVVTDKDGNASFGFVNNNLSGTYRMVIEGIDANGNLGRSVVRYKVQ